MNNIRIKKSSTGDHLSALLKLLDDKNASKIILFASELDESDTNAPLLATLIQYKIPNVGELNVIGDGTFLTAARFPRYSEIKDLLDAAETNSKVYFSLQRVPFTSQLSADEAADKLSSHQELIQLTPNTRPDFFRLLSTLTEQQYNDLYK